MRFHLAASLLLSSSFSKWGPLTSRSLSPGDCYPCTLGSPAPGLLNQKLEGGSAAYVCTHGAGEAGFERGLPPSRPASVVISMLSP